MDTGVFFVGMSTLSLINAGLAQAKNRSGLLWWFFSLFLGPIATFLIVVLPKVPPSIECFSICRMPTDFLRNHVHVLLRQFLPCRNRPLRGHDRRRIASRPAD